MATHSCLRVAAAAALLGLLLGAEARGQRPNILWITAEDICPNLGCYGDPDAVTPNLDRFAREAVRFTNTFSVHPCCSPSRSCLATGVYPTRLGTFQHRGKMWVPDEPIRCFTSLLRQAGYYCFNGSKGASSKLDYNFEPKHEPWDKIGSRAIEWRNRASGHPFFGQLNLFCTHQSQYGLRKPGVPRDASQGALHDPAKVHVPPYHPDTPGTREIWAEYHDRVTQMDQQFGALLEQLAADGLAGDTIIFFFGDNGQGIPGGKVWLWDQGPHVPLLIRFPDKWRHLAPAAPGSVSERLVSFVDFAPSVLSLAGLPVPKSIQGIAFSGPAAGPERRYAFAARDFHDAADFDTTRMVRDTRFHYLRNFMPQQGWDAIQYSWQHAPYLLDQWRREAAAGQLQAGTRQACFFRRAKPVEELYDVRRDPWQMHNVAAEPEYRETLRRMRAECEKWMIANGDLGLLSQYELYTRAEKDSPYEMALDPQRNPTQRLLAAANLANRANPAAIGQLAELLHDADSAVRRWGALGLLTLGPQAAPAADKLVSALKDPAPDVRITAAEALCNLKRVETAMPVLLELLGHESRIIRNETLLALARIGPPAQAALPHMQKALGPSRHENIWSHDNIQTLIDVARSCMTEPAATGTLHATREKYLP